MIQITVRPGDFTHYFDDGKQPGMVHAFCLDSCEDCGEPVQAPNSVHLSRNAIQPLRLQQLSSLPPELGYCEATGMAVCDDCWIPL